MSVFETVRNLQRKGTFEGKELRLLLLVFSCVLFCFVFFFKPNRNINMLFIKSRTWPLLVMNLFNCHSNYAFYS